MNDQQALTDRDIIGLLRAISQGVDPSELDLDALSPEDRGRIIRWYVRIKAARKLDRQAREDRLNPRRQKGDKLQPAQIVQEILCSYEFMVMLRIVAAAIVGATAIAHHLAFRDQGSSPTRQARLLRKLLASKLEKRVDLTPDLAMLEPDLRALANGLSLEEAADIVSSTNETISRKISDFRKRGRMIEILYRDPMARLGLHISGTYPGVQPWGLPFNEDDLPYLTPKPGEHYPTPCPPMTDQPRM